MDSCHSNRIAAFILLPIRLSVPRLQRASLVPLSTSSGSAHLPLLNPRFLELLLANLCVNQDWSGLKSKAYVPSPRARRFLVGGFRRKRKIFFPLPFHHNLSVILFFERLAFLSIMTRPLILPPPSHMICYFAQGTKVCVLGEKVRYFNQ